MLPFPTPASASAQEATNLLEWALTAASKTVLFAGLPASPEVGGKLPGVCASTVHGICCQVRLHSRSDQNSCAGPPWDPPSSFLPDGGRLVGAALVKAGSVWVPAELSPSTFWPDTVVVDSISASAHIMRHSCTRSQHDSILLLCLCNGCRSEHQMKDGDLPRFRRPSYCPHTVHAQCDHAPQKLQLI